MEAVGPLLLKGVIPRPQGMNNGSATLVLLECLCEALLGIVTGGY